MVAVAAAFAASCSSGISGSPVAAEVAPPTAADSVRQAVTDLGEAAVLRYQGGMTASGSHPATFDITAAGSGEMVGTLTLDSRPATLLVVDRSIFLKAGAEFWAALPGISEGPSKGTAVADRWVRVPAGLIGVEPADVFTPQVLGQNLLEGVDRAGDRPLADGEKAKVGAVDAVRAKTGKGAVTVASKAPHGVLKVELSEAGESDPTSVRDFQATVTDGSATAARFYQDFAASAAQVSAPVDVLTTVQESGHTFDACGAQSCSIIVNFTNPSKVAVRVSVRGNWVGDNAPLGSCETVAGPVAPGQPGAATCTLAGPEWAGFYQRANSVPGSHPYSVQWSTLVLADPPDLTKVTARAQAKPADPAARKTEGSNYVYSIGYTDGGTDVVWKYGSVATKFWSEHADQQLGTCLGSTGRVCLTTLVTATDDAASAQGLVLKLVTAYKQRTGACPAGQWVACGG
ncbi:hypothetical protein BJP25_07695 [Actinokineospora bangkokensis]|uniref:Uncharacterized protein n=1 Tax=Actinokineospora bangkokensis TaxID=1193682 RepID=A0A1Q9LT05_9PSEU|nr:hypothetical protein BJP25_07695 [Actinokineospora bangkokensis]